MNGISAYGLRIFERTKDVPAWEWHQFVQFQIKNGYDINIEVKWKVVHSRLDGEWPQMMYYEGAVGYAGNSGFASNRWNYQLAGNGNDLGNRAVFMDPGALTFLASPYNVTNRIHVVIFAVCNNWDGVNVLYN
jgi:hypothetical protein